MYPKGSPFCYGSIGKQPHNPYITFGDQGISTQDIPYSSIVERLAHTNPVGQLPGPLSYKLLDQFTTPMLPTEPQCTNVIACI